MFRLAVGARLREVERKFPNRAAAAQSAGVARSTLQAWIEGKSAASFEGLARLAAAKNISLDWLATGREKTAGEEAFDIVKFREVATALRLETESRNLALDNEQFSELCGIMYQLTQSSDRDTAKSVLQSTLRIVSSR